MKSVPCLLLAAGLVFAGCAVFSGGRSPSSYSVRRMQAADSLEQEGLYQQAADAYAQVAVRSAHSNLYPVAVRKAALLYCLSPPTIANDSAAYRWYHAYLGLPLEKSDRENARISVELLSRIIALRAQIVQLYTASDSLTVLTKRQAASMAADAHRVQETELQLQQAQSELAKIKEIDLRLSKSRNR
ncbi:MAG TPA: hypothetical protein VL221_15890 [Bacteroidota bacterium]|nr:hypothetical protein [Bacteroidota bacterium]